MQNNKKSPLPRLIISQQFIAKFFKEYAVFDPTFHNKLTKFSLLRKIRVDQLEVRKTDKTTIFSSNRI